MVWGDLWAQKKIATLNRFTFFMYKYIKKNQEIFYYMHTLQSFVQLLKEKNGLIQIDEYFSTDLEIAEIADRMMKQNDGGKAILFTNNGTKYPVLINMYGSDNRITEALYCKNLEQKSQEIETLFQQLLQPKDTIAKKLKTIPLLMDISNYFPKHQNGRGACQQVIETDNIDIFTLPVLKSWPYDGGKFITLPMVNTIDPENNIRNVGMYRIQLYDKTTTGMHWHKHKTGAAHYRKYQQQNKKMPVAIALGGDPVYAYCATAPLPEGIDEYLLAGFLRKKPVKLVHCITQPEIEVPEDCDFVIEGYIDPQEQLKTEGPFGDHTGFYSLADQYPVFHITAITHRRDAIYPATIVGVPPMEDAWISKATEKIFTYPIKLTYVPELQQLHMPSAGVEHNITIVKIKPQYEGTAIKVKNTLWGAGQMMFNKILAIYTGEQDITNYKQFLQEALKTYNPKEHTYIDNQGISDVLDHSSRKFTIGGKICFDLTQKNETIEYNPENKTIDKQKLKDQYPEITKINNSLLGENIPIVFIEIKEKKQNSVKKIAKQLVEKDNIPTKILIFVDEGIPENDYNILTWYASSNIDPSHDCWILPNKKTSVLCIDSTAKTLENDGFTRQWPEVVTMDDEVIKKVNEKNCVKKYKNLLSSPSIKLKKLRYNNGAVKYFNSEN